MSVICVQGLHKSTEYFLFRPIGNDTYKEIKFVLIHNTIVENKATGLLNAEEREFVENNLI